MHVSSSQPGGIIMLPYIKQQNTQGRHNSQKAGEQRINLGSTTFYLPTLSG